MGCAEPARLGATRNPLACAWPARWSGRAGECEFCVARNRVRNSQSGVSQDRNRGCRFTLIELLIALAILALVAGLGYRALASLTDSESKLAAEGAHWRNLDAMFARLEADARGALPRDVRTDAGTEPAWIGRVDNAGDAEMRFSRAGPEFTLESGSGGQRIGYRLRNGAIEVLYWPYLDQPASVADFQKQLKVRSLVDAFQ